MSAGMKLHGLQAALAALSDVERNYKAAAERELEKGAKEIAALARDFAPVDTHNLEKSIRAQRIKEGGNISWRIKLGGKQGDRDIDLYAISVHERLKVTRGGKTRGAPGTNPGKKSRNKASALGVPVGGKFLSRAYNALYKDIKANIAAALNGESKRIGRGRR